MGSRKGQNWHPKSAHVLSAFNHFERLLTRLLAPSTFKVSLMSVSKIQIGQLWKKNGTGEVYLVTRLYSEALNTMVVLRQSGAEDKAQIRLRVERDGNGQTIPGFSPAMEDDKL